MNPISSLFKVWFSIFCIDENYCAKISVKNNTNSDVNVLNNFGYYMFSTRKRKVYLYSNGEQPMSLISDALEIRLFDPKNKCEIGDLCHYEIPVKKNGKIRHGRKKDVQWNLLSKSGVLGAKYKRRTWAGTEHAINRDILKKKNIVFLKADSIFSDTIQLPGYVFLKSTYTCEAYNKECVPQPIDSVSIEVINQLRFSYDLDDKPKNFKRIYLLSDTVKVKLK